MAVFLGALIVLGLEPGPRMMMDRPEVVLVLIYTLVAGNILVALIGIFGAAALVKITYVPTSLLAPVIFMLGLMGAYLTHGMFSDVILALVFGVLAFAMKRFDFPRVAVVIAIVLGGLAQKTFHQTLMLWGYKGFFVRPISLGLFVVTVAMVVLPYIRAMRRRRRGQKLSR
jgi:TctA family transporter